LQGDAQPHEAAAQHAADRSAGGEEEVAVQSPLKQFEKSERRRTHESQCRAKRTEARKMSRCRPFRLVLRVTQRAAEGEGVNLL